MRKNNALLYFVAFFMLLSWPGWSADISDMTGITGKIGQGDINYGNGTDTDTFQVDEYDGSHTTLIKVPSPRADVYSIYKGKWYVAASTDDQGSATTEGTLAYIISTYGGSDLIEIEIPGNYTYTLGTNLSIPSNVLLSFQKGAVVSISSGKTLTIDNPDNIHTQGGLTQKIFEYASGTAAVSFTNGGTVSAGWWGTASGVFPYCLDAMGSTETFTLLVPSVQTVATSDEITSNIHPVIVGKGGFSLSSGQTLTISGTWGQEPGPQQIFTGTGTVVFSYTPTVRPQWWGTGATALNAAVIAGDTGTVKFWPGTYSISSGVSKTLTGAQRWTAEGPVTVKYTGASLATMVILEMGGNFTMDGPFIFDGNNAAGTALWVRNSDATMSGAVDVHITNFKGMNLYSNVNSRGVYAIMTQGAFNHVKLDKCSAVNLCRETGITGSYVQAFVNAYVDATCYARTVTITDPYCENIYSTQVYTDPTYYDMHGIAITGPAADLNGGVKMDTTLIVRGGTFRNIAGNSIKSQMEHNTVDGATFIVDSSGYKKQQSGHEIDFQFGSGVVVNCKGHYGVISGGASPFQSSWSFVNASFYNRATEEGALVVSSNEICNNVPQGTDAMPYFITIVPVGTLVGQNVTANHNTFLGAGNLEQFINGDLAYVRSIQVVGNFINDLSGGMITPSGAAGDCYVFASGNYNLGTARYMVAGSVYPYPVYSGFGNVGFTEGDGAFNTFNTIRGTSGGLKRRYAEATVDIPASTSATISLSIPSGCRLLGAQLRVDSALATGDLWDAAYSAGAGYVSIANTQAVALNTKVSKLFDEHAASPITSASTDIVITKSGGGSFTEQGTIRGIVYFEALATMGSL